MTLRTYTPAELKEMKRAHREDKRIKREIERAESRRNKTAPIGCADLMRLLHYCPETGLFTWLVARGGNASNGACAGAVADNGYITIKALGRNYRAHELAWCYMNGAFPDRRVIHRNGNTSDNRWANLRQAGNMRHLHNDEQNNC